MSGVDTGKYFLSFDLSTQSLKAILANDQLHIVSEECVHFDTDLREFKTENGVHRGSDGITVTSPTLMWVKAVDVLLMKMAHNGVNFGDISVISGTAQQHGSVYWSSSAELTLQHLHHGATLLDQLQSCFVVQDSPVWMDSSTRKQCMELEAAAQGPLALASMTGSKAYERFTGAQIAKFHQENTKVFNSCERIALVSSFLASLFLGRHAPIDFSDGSGMNLLNIHTKQWETKLLDACAPNLAPRLGVPVPSTDIIGKVSRYMVERYRFPPNCSIVAFTGDNPASLAGMRLSKADIALSLGTSDTLIFSTDVAVASTEGHVFVNPLDKSKYMAMLCFKNGSLAREAVCNRCCDSSWDTFNDALSKTPPGNNGNLGLYFDEMEILPYAKGVHRWNEANQLVSEFENDIEVRAIIEGQFLAKRHHVQKYGFVRDPCSRILATGGASKNDAILQVISDIFNTPVYTSIETANSACLGCVYRCAQARIGSDMESFEETVKHLPPHQLVCTPNADNVELYESLLQRYIQLERSVAAQFAPKVVAPPPPPVAPTTTVTPGQEVKSVNTTAPPTDQSPAAATATQTCTDVAMEITSPPSGSDENASQDSHQISTDEGVGPAEKMETCTKETTQGGTVIPNTTTTPTTTGSLSSDKTVGTLVDVVVPVLKPLDECLQQSPVKSTTPTIKPTES